MEMNYRTSLRAVFVIVLALLAGCAFGTRQPTLFYPPRAESSVAPQPAAAAAPATSTKDVHVIVFPFLDHREDKGSIGTVRNGFGMRTAEVIPTNSVPDWVTQAVKADLQKDGYSVAIAPSDRPPSAGTVTVSGDVLKAYCDMYFSYSGEVSLNVKVSRDGRELLNKNYSGEGSAGAVWTAEAESFAQSLAKALESALKPMRSDFGNAIAK